MCSVLVVVNAQFNGNQNPNIGQGTSSQQIPFWGPLVQSANTFWSNLLNPNANTQSQQTQGNGQYIPNQQAPWSGWFWPPRFPNVIPVQPASSSSSAASGGTGNAQASSENPASAIGGAISSAISSVGRVNPANENPTNAGTNQSTINNNAGTNQPATANAANQQPISNQLADQSLI